MSGTELAQRSGVSGPAVSQLLSALEDAGLVERQLGTEDRRRLTLTLSPASPASGALTTAPTRC